MVAPLPYRWLGLADLVLATSDKRILHWVLTGIADAHPNNSSEIRLGASDPEGRTRNRLTNFIHY